MHPSSCHVYEHVQAPGVTNTLQRYSKIVSVSLLCLNTFQKYNSKIYCFLNYVKKYIFLKILFFILICMALFKKDEYSLIIIVVA